MMPHSPVGSAAPVVTTLTDVAVRDTSDRPTLLVDEPAQVNAKECVVTANATAQPIVGSDPS